MAHLVQESGEKKGRRFELVVLCVIGRLKSCDIPIKDAKASRNNSKISLEAGRFLLEDMGSSNGTFLNGEQIRRAPLKNGDLVKVGNTEFRFHDTPAPRSAPPKATPPPRPPARPAAPPPAPTPADLARMETPPGGIPSPAPEAFDEASDEDVEELDLGDEEPEGFPGPLAAPSPFPAAAPPEAPKPKPVVISRVPLHRTTPKGRSKNFFFEDVSQRSALFRALLYIGAIALMGFLAWLSFRLVKSAF